MKFATRFDLNLTEDFKLLRKLAKERKRLPIERKKANCDKTKIPRTLARCAIRAQENCSFVGVRFF
jgi:hypothetical protein